MWIADAHRDNNRRFVVHADETLTAFLELESAIRLVERRCGNGITLRGRGAVQATVAQQQKTFDSRLAEQQKQIEALTAGLQKVSAQLEASKPAPQVVNNP